MQRFAGVPGQSPWYWHKYSVFENVLVRNGSIEFVHPADQPPADRITEPYLFHSDAGPRKNISGGCILPLPAL